jgi:hypothetical protein
MTRARDMIWPGRVLLLGLLALPAGGCIEDPVDPPHYGVHMGVVLAGQAEGRLSWGPATGQDPTGRAMWLRTLMVGPDLQPDFLDQSVPPFCMAFRWSAQDEIPTLDAADAGDVTVTGHTTVKSVPWGVNPPPTPTALPGQIRCQRALHPGRQLHVYGCNIDPMVGLTGEALTDKTALGVDVTGGSNIGAFSVSGIKPATAAEPGATFDLNQIDPKQVTASWVKTSANMVVIELFGQLVDSADFTKPLELGQILCMEPASSGTKEIPYGALSVLPKPSGSRVLMLQTTLLGFDLHQDIAGWGRYMVGAGRGTLGLTCRTASGDLCPAPQSP